MNKMLIVSVPVTKLLWYLNVGGLNLPFTDTYSHEPLYTSFYKEKANHEAE